MKIRIIVLALCAAFSLRAQPVLRLHGSTTVQGALEQKQAEIEALLGARLEFQGGGSNTGLLALAADRTEIAMISSPLDELARRLNEKKAGTIGVAEFRAASIGAVRLAFIVNPRNPVRHLTAAQLADILTGRIKSWKEVGGASMPIVVVSLANAGSLVQEKLLGGATITAEARQLPLATQIPPVVALDPGAIGIISAAHVRGKTSLVTTDAEILAPLFLVTRGEPAPLQLKLIELARRLLHETG